MNKTQLLILPSVSIWKENNSFIFDRKFYDGLLRYIEYWPGEVSCIMKFSDTQPPDFGLVKKLENELPFHFSVLNKKESLTSEHLKKASIVLASADSHDQLHVSELCRDIGIKCVYIIEYIPETRYQIAALSTLNPIVSIKRNFFIWRGEQKRLKAFSCSDGLQINGSAGYAEYNRFDNGLLYFDSRINPNMLIEENELDARHGYLKKNKSLRLAFSGRLIRMKGADHLVQLAKQLKNRNIDFHFSIYGSGELEQEMKTYLSEQGLEQSVSMHGAIDFYQQLIPDLKQNVDLFVCLHRQSDPSCTYLETLSCGLPIIGYENQAFSGLLKQADIGWGVDLDDLQSVAHKISFLNLNREQIIEKSKQSLLFAKKHDFESTFLRRIKHLYDLVI